MYNATKYHRLNPSLDGVSPAHFIRSISRCCSECIQARGLHKHHWAMLISTTHQCYVCDLIFSTLIFDIIPLDSWVKFSRIVSTILCSQSSTFCNQYGLEKFIVCDLGCMTQTWTSKSSCHHAQLCSFLAFLRNLLNKACSVWNYCCCSYCILTSWWRFMVM